MTGRGTVLAPLMAGMDDLARLLAATLGPAGGRVVSGVGTGSHELLADSATIARRITGLGDRRTASGAALLREVVQGQGHRYGDGGAVTAVLTRAISRAAHRAVVAGAESQAVRAGVERATAVAAAAVRAGAASVAGEKDLAGLLFAATGDHQLADVLAEVLDTVGAEGGVHLEEHDGVAVERVYPDGARFRCRPAARDALYGAYQQLTLAEPLVAVVQDELRTVAPVRALLDAALASGSAGRPLLVIAPDIDGEALTMLKLNDNAGRLTVVGVAITTPRMRLGADLEDLALLTGATVLGEERGQGAAACRAGDLGRARWARVQSGHLTVAGDRRPSPALRSRAEVLAGLARRIEQDGGDAEPVRRRRHRLLGTLAAVQIGAPAEAERALRRRTADKAVRVARAALREGVVTGGGVALIEAQPAVTAAMASATDRDERLGHAAVRDGLEAVFLRLVANAGRRNPRVALDGLRSLGPGHALDTATDEYVPAAGWPVRDPAGVVAGAVEAAGRIAALLATSAVVVPAGSRR